MMEAGIIQPVEESEWISLMVFQEKKQGGIRICIDLRKLNDACLHDPFPTPFTDEVLENIGGHEFYSFTDGFSRYHQIKIALEERYKTTFSIEWGSYQYTVMPFGLNNAPTIFSRVVIVAFKEFIYQFLEVYLDDWTVYSLLKDHVEVL
jgi:putative transposase